MKLSYLIIFSFLLSGYNSYAQNTPWSTTAPIGIGTTSPNGVLQVNGISSFAGNSSNLDNRNNTISLNYLANSAQMVLGWNRGRGSGETDFIANQGGGNVGGFAFYNHDNSNNEKILMWILGSGQVVIGDTQGKQGNYLLAVAGSAIATSVTVKTVANWPDYVFKKNYQLPPLSEVKAYIDQNQHLPEVPSASEVEKNGLDLGEMNKLLIKKVEELTLYLIEKDIEDKALKNTLRKLSDRLQVIEKNQSR